MGYVTLTDYHTHKRQDFQCGPWDDVASRQRYTQLVTEWEAAGRRLSLPVDESLAVVEIVAAFRREIPSVRFNAVIKPLVGLYGETPAEAFGPNMLRNVRAAMVAAGWNRTNINSQVHRLMSIFRWAASHELIPAAVYESLKTIEPLKRGKTTAPESREVQPVAVEYVNAIKPHVSRQVWAVVQLQLLTGARPGELLTLRPRDLDRSSVPWIFAPAEHKTAHRDKSRTIYFGPRAVEILTPFLLRPDDRPLFSPSEAEAERREMLSQHRKTPLSCGNRPGMHRARIAKVAPGDTYTRDSYRRAIARACDVADLRAKGGLVIGNDERLIPRWFPYQLRHTAATQIRKQFGLEAAQIVLGHSSALVTDAVYAQRDMEKAAEVIRKIG